MTTRYVNFHRFARGVKRENGQGKLCLHCTRDASTRMTRKQGKFSMTVDVCDTHADVAHEINAHA